MTHDKDDDLMEDLFAQARARPPMPSEALMARVLADAQAAHTARATGGWRAVLAALGGIPALGGLVTATCVGFWLGIAPPASIPDIAGGLFESDLAIDGEMIAPTLTGFGWDIEEG